MEGYIANVTTSFIEIPGVICSSIYMTGCSFNCQGCQNPELQKLSAGYKMSVMDVVDRVDENHLAKWVCFLGGEPFYQSEFLFEICKKINKPIGIYTGNEYHTLLNTPLYQSIVALPNVLYLKTGRFLDKLVTIEEYPVTKNQEVRIKCDGVWTVVQTRKLGEVSHIVQSITHNCNI
jgi:anaerobic ribonucleoside-triphosphate reductase activating protein